MNTRDCEHGHLARSCEICARDEEIIRLAAEVYDLKARLKEADMIVKELNKTRGNSCYGLAWRNQVFKALDKANRYFTKWSGK